jgi:hypothetical protein
MEGGECAIEDTPKSSSESASSGNVLLVVEQYQHREDGKL